MGRIRLPPRPDVGRVRQARVAAARVAVASTAEAAAEAVVAVELSIRTDYDAAFASVEARLDALEP